MVLRLLREGNTGIIVPDEYAALKTTQRYLETTLTSMDRRYNGGESMLGDSANPVLASQLNHLVEMNVYDGTEWEGTVKRRTSNSD